MASEAQKVISDEQFDQIVLEVYEYVKSGKLSKMRVKGVADDLIKKLDDDGKLMFHDARYPGEYRPINRETMYGRVNPIVVNWRKYLVPLMTPLLVEALHQQTLKAKDNPASFKTVAAIIMPPESANESEPPVSPRSEAILQRGEDGMESTISIGKDHHAGKAGDNGHECADTVHSVADGHGLGDKPESQNIPTEVVSLRDDRVVHGVHEGADTAHGSIVSYSPFPLEDTVDNNGGDDMGTPE